MCALHIFGKNTCEYFLLLSSKRWSLSPTQLLISFYMRIGSAGVFIFYFLFLLGEVLLLFKNGWDQSHPLHILFSFLGFEGHRLSQERCFDTTVIFLFQKYHKSVPEMDCGGIYQICHLLSKGEIQRLSGPLQTLSTTMWNFLGGISSNPSLENAFTEMEAAGFDLWSGIL